MGRIGLLLFLMVVGLGLRMAIHAGWLDASANRRPEQIMTSTNSNPPLACNLGAIPADRRERHAELLHKLSSEVIETRELADGYAFRFDSEAATVTDLAEWIALESGCCPFLGYALEVEPNHGAVWLRLTGDTNVKTFVGETFAAK